MSKWDEEQRQAERDRQAGKSGQDIPTQAGQEGYKEWKESQKSNWEPTTKSSGCYITTACCEYAGLSDNCKELKTLRNFRDRFILHKPRGAEELEEYYTTAPKIIEKINSNEASREVYKTILRKVRTAVSLIEEGKNEEAYDLYKSSVLELKKNYLNE